MLLGEDRGRPATTKTPLVAGRGFVVLCRGMDQSSPPLTALLFHSLVLYCFQPAGIRLPGAVISSRSGAAARNRSAAGSCSAADSHKQAGDTQEPVEQGRSSPSGSRSRAAAASAVAS